ncbi:hypothetical protein BH11CYA1_BH11CYA1_49580 [soil metagenome]
MSHHHHHRHEQSNSVEQDEKSVTKWLNKMESSLASPQPTFSITDFSPKEIKAINTYMHSHEKSLGRYDQFLPHVQISDTKDKASC